MQVSVEALEGLTRKMRVAVPQDDFQTAYQKSVKQLSKQVQLNGFRRGKVPLRVVEQQFGGRARQDALSQVLEATYPKALEQVDMRPVGQPEIDVDSLEGDELVYTATFDIYPDIQLQGLDGIKVERPTTEISDGDVDNVLNRLLEQRRTWPEKETAAADGDRVTIDFEGTVDGEGFAGGSAEDTAVVLGAGRFLKDLEAGIVGMTPGSEKTVPVQFPDDYHNDDLKSKAAEFRVTLKKVESSELPTIDEEFLKSVGVEEGGEAALRDKLRENLVQERDKLLQQWEKTQVLEGVLAANPIEVPAPLIADDVVRLRQETVQRMGPQLQGMSSEQLEQMIPDDALEPQARRRSALGLLLGEIIKQDKITVDQAKIDERLQEMAADYDQPEEAISYYRSNQEFMSGLRAVVLEDQIVARLLEKASISETSLSFDDLSQKVRG